MLVAHANILSSPLSLLNMKYTLYSAQYSCYPNRKINLSLQNWQDCCYLLIEYGVEYPSFCRGKWIFEWPPALAAICPKNVNYNGIKGAEFGLFLKCKIS